MGSAPADPCDHITYTVLILHTTQTTVAFFLFLECREPVPTSGPLHLLLPPPGTHPCPDLRVALLRTQLQYHQLLRKASLDLPNSSRPILPGPSLHFFTALINQYLKLSNFFADYTKALQSRDSAFLVLHYVPRSVNSI